MEINQALRRHLFILLLLPAAWLCCKTKSSSPQQAQPGGTVQVSDTLRQMMAEWKSDSVGCEKKRSKAAAESLLQGMKLENGNMKDFTEVFGIPNKQLERNGKTTFVYYFDAACTGGKPGEGSDYCAAEFSFREGRFEERQYICL